MKKLTLVVLLIIFLFFLFMSIDSRTIRQVCFKDQCFSLEIADTPELRKQGLMNRESFPENKAMLFVFEKPGLYAFHMKNVSFPLDIVWLNKNKEIVFIHKALPEEKNIIPDSKAKYVLEINPGLLKMSVGDKLEFRY